MTGKLDIEIGLPVATPIRGNGRVNAGVLPAGRYASLVYTGVTNDIAGNAALLAWAEERGIVWDRRDTPEGDAFRARVETEYTDPADEPDMAKWETEVAIKLADVQE